MNAVRDPLDDIRAYAPPTPPADEMLLGRVFDGEPVGGRRTHRGRAMLAGAAAVTVLGVGTAAAAGVGPSWVWNRVFGPSAPGGSAYQPDPATARQVFVVSGPDGQDFAGWTVANKVGWRCTAMFFEPAGSTTPPRELTDGSPVHTCVLATPPAPGLFADGVGASASGENDRLEFVYQSGDAVRAELRISDGRTLPITVRDGYLGGWYTREQIPLGESATIVAFDADGQELDSLRVLDQFGCTDPEGC